MSRLLRSGLTRNALLWVMALAITGGVLLGIARTGAQVASAAEQMPVLSDWQRDQCLKLLAQIDLDSRRFRHLQMSPQQVEQLQLVVANYVVQHSAELLELERTERAWRTGRALEAGNVAYLRPDDRMDGQHRLRAEKLRGLVAEVTRELNLSQQANWQTIREQSRQERTPPQAGLSLITSPDALNESWR
jgi:hypothetical protein